MDSAILFSAIDWLGIGLGFLLIGVVLTIASMLDRYRLCAPFVTRKVVHIGVGHWWFVAWYFHGSVAPALVGPVVFTVANYLFYRRERVHANEHTGAGANFGIVLYPVSLIILVVASWSGPLSHTAAAAGVMVMAWGDGLAAIAGETISRRVSNRSAAGISTGVLAESLPFLPTGEAFGSKTVGGSATMFAASFLIVSALGLSGAVPSVFRTLAAAAGVAGISTAAEAFTPWNLDNISVPLLASGTYMLLIGGA